MKALNHQLFAFVLLLTAVGTVLGQDSKVGYINTQRVLTESAPAKVAQAKLEQEFGKRQRDLADLQVSLRAASEKFERDAPTFTESQRFSRQKELSDLNRELQRKQRDLSEEGNARRNDETLAVLEKANKAIKQVAEAEKYDLVVDQAIYYKHDITDKVLKILNATGK